MAQRPEQKLHLVRDGRERERGRCVIDEHHYAECGVLDMTWMDVSKELTIMTDVRVVVGVGSGIGIIACWLSGLTPF